MPSGIRCLFLINHDPRAVFQFFGLLTPQHLLLDSIHQYHSYPLPHFTLSPGWWLQGAPNRGKCLGSVRVPCCSERLGWLPIQHSVKWDPFRINSIVLTSVNVESISFSHSNYSSQDIYLFYWMSIVKKNTWNWEGKKEQVHITYAYIFCFSQCWLWG